MFSPTVAYLLPATFSAGVGTGSGVTFALAALAFVFALAVGDALGVGLNEGRGRSRLTSGLRWVVRLGLARSMTLETGAG